ncbi:periodic tryptophan protein 1-like protein [Cucumis melo var. makuwa]|uniref:Periodic tryptophan protein 1-like protein n=1 Tax=Cucumis melo var. makuwa TaxID=1194695 RepID=A0A5D3BBF1_CUCMM|nr:periodic tryptophan protein 1-like protein [Cucumis melo var. makuwa]
MISAVSWVPKGVCKPVPDLADPPSQEIIDELLKSSQVVEDSSKHSDDEADEEDMDVEDPSDEEIANALAVAQALGKSSETTNLETKYDDIAEGLKELDMDNYDNEDDGGVFKEFFERGILNSSLVETFVSSIPKKETQIGLLFRPISLITSVYKIFAKAFANRLRKVLPSTISDAQGAFLTGRQILDLALIANESIEEYRSENLRKCAVFHSHNGAPKGSIQASRGLREGDPLSSFLFLLAVDVFSRMISKGVEGNIIELFKIDRNEVALSHLQFFDDTMLFCFGKEESFQILNHIVESFEDMSGLKINSSKCTIFYINFEHAKLQRWMEVFDREVGSFSSLYLRLPYGEIELFTSGAGDVYYPSNDMDPYLKDKDGDDSEDIEDETIKPTDAVIICACSEDNVSALQARGDPNFYIHRDIIIPAFPLCTAWLDCPLKGGERGNFIAVGSMEPSIEIWDLDITSVTYKENSHTDSVLGLAWNKEFRNILASASADKQVKIWDVSTGQCNITMQHHTDKVQAVAWNHHSSQVLLSGSFDHSVALKDGRNPSHSGYKWQVTADVESLAWDPHTEHMFVVSLEDGTVKGFDIRNATTETSSETKASFTLHAHEKAVCSVSYSPSAPNLLATGSTDKMVKLWDLSNNEPSCVASTNPKAGAVFSVSFSEDCPFLLAIGGSKGKLEVWDTLTDAAVSRKYGNYRQQRS